jgi:alkylation response protein AidB-like acyl-CoA dehydrogenase
MLDLLVPDAEKYHEVLGSFASFTEKEILPHAKAVDQEAIFPRENLIKLQNQGIMSMPFPPDMNGLGFPVPVYAAALEILSKACANTALQVSVQGMVCEGIRSFGNDRQRNRYLKEYGLVGGKRLAAFALTEPCCGSDARSLQTKARLSGNTYLLTGSKTLITNAGEADFILVFAKTDRGISVFIVPREASGMKIMKDMPKLGLRGNRLSAVHFEDCRVPGENLLGEEGKGLDYAKQMLNAGRVTIGAIAVGIAQAAYERALSYSKRRQAFGQSISDFQLVQEKLADMVMHIGAARLLVVYAASLRDRGADVTTEAARAKLFSTEMALRVCDSALQIHGGYGYVDAYDVHRHWRDARGLTIGEGTSDMLKLLLAHRALKEE